MDFARKQLAKFGWKEGTGLGKNSQGILQAIKPNLKVGKEGMGYDFSKELVDTWWTRAYDDSLNRINVESRVGSSETIGVTLRNDEEHTGGEKAVAVEERPFDKMRKRMMKATFTTFSKGATLSNGEMIGEPQSDPDSDGDRGKSAKRSKKPMNRALTDEELFQACGGRTTHKAARFGLKLNGKLARIAAQEKAAKDFINCSTSTKTANASSNALKFKHEDQVSSSLAQESEKNGTGSRKKKQLTNSCSDKVVSESTGTAAISEEQLFVEDYVVKEDVEEDSKIKKRKKHKNRKYLELETCVDSIQRCSKSPKDALQDASIINGDCSLKNKTKFKKSKKRRKEC